MHTGKQKKKIFNKKIICFIVGCLIGIILVILSFVTAFIQYEIAQKISLICGTISAIVSIVLSVVATIYSYLSGKEMKELLNNINNGNITIVNNIKAEKLKKALGENSVKRILNNSEQL